MKGSHGSVFAYNSTWHACKIIFQKEGIYGLYKGNVPNLAKVRYNSATWDLFCLIQNYRNTFYIYDTAGPIGTCHLNE